MDLISDLEGFLAAAKADYAARATDGFDFKDGVQFSLAVLKRSVTLAERFTIPGPDKKAAVLVALGQAYDLVILPLDLPGPDMIIDPALRASLLKIADGAIEFFVSELPA
jgi:hypothetical protein